MAEKKLAESLIHSDDPTMLQTSAHYGERRAPEGDTIDVKFEEAKNDYVLTLQEQVDNGEKRKPTLTTYKAGLNRYGRWLDANGYAGVSVTEAMATAPIRKYLGDLAQEHKNCGTSRRNAHGILNSFCAHLVASRYMRKNPMELVQKPRKSEAHQAVPTDEEVAKVMVAAERQYNKRDAAMSVALLATMAYAGLRASEVAKMQVRDVDFREKVLYVPDGKGAKSATMYPDPEFFAAIRNWLVFRGQIGCRHDRLWAHDRNRSISDEWLRDHLRDLKSRAGLDEDAPILPHAIRRWMATRLGNEAGLMAAQKALRHSDPQTTALYLKAGEKDARKLATHNRFDAHAVVHGATAAEDTRARGRGDVRPPSTPPEAGRAVRSRAVTESQVRSSGASHGANEDGVRSQPTSRELRRESPMAARMRSARRRY